MSKMNAFRIINLSYNHNAMRVDDETWQFHGESTLLSLRNGGGKSVLVQMMIAPFVHKKFRNAKDRPFSSYFTTNKPTFLLVEWQLDDQAGYVLTGMMVRQHQVVAEEESTGEELDMVCFICEYAGANPYDIHHIPLIEQQDGSRKLKGYKACLDLFNGWKNDRDLKFFSFDMNSSSQSRAYFNKLEEYRIYYKEWETIIKKINAQESGLSELFADAKDERRLIEKWFLEAVENKLNKTENRMKEFQRLMLQYIQQYKENRLKIEKKARIEQFHTDTEPLQQAVDDYVQLTQRGGQLKNQIAHLLVNLTNELQRTEAAVQDTEAQLQQLQAEMVSLRYDQHSWNYYQLEDSCVAKQQQEQQLADQCALLEQKLQTLKRQADCLECARRDFERREAEQELLKLENQLELLHKEQEQLQPEREQYGYTLRYRYTELLEQQQRYLDETLQELDAVKTQKQTLEAQLRQQQKLRETNLRTMGRLMEQLHQYDRQEERFNKQYGQQLARNLMGEYEPGVLENFGTDQEQMLHRLQQRLTELARQKEEHQQQKHQQQRQKDDLQKQLGQLTAELAAQQKLMARLQQELAVRETLVEHVGLQKEQALDTQALLDAFQQRIDELQEAIRLLRNQTEDGTQRYRDLQEGRLLKLPTALKEGLESLGIQYVFGMEWLKQNGFAPEKNQALVTANPFIPYSLIMSRKELTRLQSSGLAVTTDFPVPVVPREMLESAAMNHGPICVLHEQVTFYVLFDQRLLDHTALEQLLARQMALIEGLQEQQAQRQEELAFYQSKADLLKGQQLDKALFQETTDNINRLRTEQQTAEAQSHQLRDSIEQLEQALTALEKQTRSTDQQLKRQEQLQIDLQTLCASYGQYREQQKERNGLQEQLAQQEQLLTEGQAQQTQLEEQQQTLLDARRDRQNQVGELERQRSKYLQYTERPLIQKDMEDLLSRYEALTQQTSAQQQDLERQRERADGRYKRLEKDLLDYSNSCGLVTDDYREVHYDAYVKAEVEQEQRQQQSVLTDVQAQKNNCHTEVRLLAQRMELALQDLQKQLGYGQMRPRQEVVVVDFDRVLAEKQHSRKQLEQHMAQIADRARLYQEHLDGLAEFSDFTIDMPLDAQPVLSRMDKQRLAQFRGQLVRDYRGAMEAQRDAQDHLYKQTDQLGRKAEYQEDFFAIPLKTLLTLTAMPDDYQTQLQVTQASYRQMLEKLEVDIAFLGREKDKIQETFLSYLFEIHRQMGNIDRNSTVHVRGRVLKMLKLTLPNWDDNEELYVARLKQYLDDLTAKCVALLEANQNIEEAIGNAITTKELYDTVVGISNIDIRLYKIEERQEYQIHWADVASNSGGEGFLSAFIILSSILSFQRWQESDLFLEREESKVLVMDNPFAQTNAAHLLVPMMDIARRTNIQLICLSGLGGDSIYSRFDNIYILTPVSSGLNRSVEYLRGRHIKGTEVDPQTMLSAHIESEEMEQIELF